MALFQKREEVFCRRDSGGWKTAKKILRDAGIRGVRAWHYETEPPVGGCGCKLDIRNFGPGGPVDRETYVITVPEAEAERARKLLEQSSALQK